MQKYFYKSKKEYGSFREYLKGFTGEQQIIEVDKTTSPLSDALSADLVKRGMKFVGSTIHLFLSADNRRYFLARGRMFYV